MIQLVSSCQTMRKRFNGTFMAILTRGTSACRTLAHVAVLCLLSTLLCGFVGSDGRDDSDPLAGPYGEFLLEIRSALVGWDDDEKTEEIEKLRVVIDDAEKILHAEEHDDDVAMRRISIDHGISIHLPAAYLPERHLDRFGGVSVGFEAFSTRVMARMSLVHGAIDAIRRHAQREDEEINQLLSDHFESRRAVDLFREVHTAHRESANEIHDAQKRFIVECLLAMKVFILPAGVENGLQRYVINGRDVFIPSPDEEGTMASMISATIFIEEADKLVELAISNFQRAESGKIEPGDIELSTVLRLLSGIEFTVEREDGESTEN